MTNKDRRFSRNQDRVLQGHKRRVTQRKWASALSIFVILCTVLPLVLPAFTLENETFCGYQEHTHSEACYTTTKELTCGYEEGQVIELEPVAHVHTDECWQTIPAAEETRELICGYEEGQVIELEPIAHVHTDECWQIIPAEEEGGEETKVLICEHEEGELIPQFVVHTHTDECWKITPATEETKVLVCGHEEGELIPQSTTHTHTDACYTETTTLTCTIPEHVHTEACLSNPKAGVETYNDWANLFYNVEKSGDWAKDLVMIAKTQLGYHDVTENFIINNDGSKSYYSRYGAWYGIPYGEWCAMFASFCLHYSDIPRESFPWAAGCTNWGETLKTMGLYEEAANGYKAKPGDLIFFRYKESESGLDHVGIVIENAKDILTVIEGNYTHEVAKTSYNITDPTIMGYGVMPENPALNEQPVPNGEESSETSEPITEDSSELIVEESSEVIVEETEEESSEILVEETGEESSEVLVEEETEIETEPETEPIAADHSDDPDVKRDELEGNTVEYPEAVFEEELDDGTKVIVNAPKGAFPAGTTMKVEKIDQDEVASVIEENVKGELTQAIALDITFLNGQGQEIEPQKLIKVQIINDSITPESGKATVVHIDNEGKGQVIDQKKDEEDSSTVTFESDTFSIYVVAYSLEDEVITYDGETFRITVTCGPEAQIPENAQLKVEEILPDSEAYQEYLMKTIETLEENQKVTFVRLFDITILVDGKEVQPAAPVAVQIELINNIKSEEVVLDDEVLAIHFDEEEEEPEVLETAVEETTVTFNTDGFSVYGIVGTTIQTIIQASDGNNYLIKVAYTEEAGIPEGSTLEVREILADTIEYENYSNQAASYMADQMMVLENAKFFDISIIYEEKEVQPLASVTVSVELAESLGEEIKAIHFGSTDIDLYDTNLQEDKIVFDASGFSVYGLVTFTASSIADLDGTSYMLFNNQNYFTNTISNGCIGKTTNYNNAVLYTFERDSNSGLFYISTEVSGETKYIHMDNNGALSFVSDSDKTGFTVETDTGVFRLYYLYQYQDTEGKTITEKYFLTYTDQGFTGKQRTYADDEAIVNIVFKEVVDLDGKEFSLINTKDGNDPSGIAMLVTPANATSLTGLSTKVKINTINRVDYVYVAESSEITKWIFEKVSGSDDKYHIKVNDNGTLKYLKISDTGVSTIDETASTTDPDCTITVTYDTTTNKFKFSTANGALSLSDGNFIRVANTTNNANVWMSLAEMLTLHDDDFRVYTANKVSVSGTIIDPNSLEDGQLEAGLANGTYTLLEDGTYIEYDVKDGDQVILYTRIWDGSKYLYYVVDYDGMLIRAYEKGDTLSWVGSKTNTMLWDFTELTKTATVNGNTVTVPSYNYYLVNKTRTPLINYIAPQGSDDPEYCREFLSSNAVSLNLNGRYNKEYYSTLVAWDYDNAVYASIFIDENYADRQHAMRSAPLSYASDFYFAKMTTTPDQSQQTVTPISTVDNNQFGITLKMQNYGGSGKWDSGKNRAKEQLNVFGNTTYYQWTGSKNLVEKYMTGNYPKVMVSGHTSQTLEELYSNAVVVNQTFLMGTYNETGYFEYDSTKNFAHLIWQDNDPWIGIPRPGGGTYQKGDFVVYDELGTSEEGGKPTLHHGQFFPYNDLAQTVTYDTNTGEYNITPRYSVSGYVNDKDIHATDLSSLDPNNGTPMYGIPWLKGHDSTEGYVDHFFGMEMTATFMQSEGGRDAWGHDLIFEFSGDDDFWLYVDGVRVLDLGGIHSALDASINFRTGQVIEQIGENQYEYTTLRARFRAAYLEEHPGASNNEINAWLNTIFEDDGSNTGTVFKDFSSHTMRMFYMERGAGASNLRMRFNLASYKQGEVLLEKEVEGSDNYTEKFPFQIYYNNPIFSYLDDNNNHLDAEGNPLSETDPTNTPVFNQSINPVLVGSAYDLLYDLKNNTTGVSEPDGILDTGVIVKDKDGNVLTPSDYTIDGITYENVFWVSPGETVSINFGREDITYYIVECGTNTDLFTGVYLNDLDHPIPPVDTDPVSNTLKDYPIASALVSQRKKVKYINKIDPNAVKTIQITKRLWQDSIGGAEITGDKSNFSVTVYIGKDTNGEYTAYNQGDYCIKDSDGKICYYDPTTDSYIPFESHTIQYYDDNHVLQTKYIDYSTAAHPDKYVYNYWELDDTPPYPSLRSDKDKGIIQSSRRGVIDNLKPGYSIEIWDLTYGTPFKVEERIDASNMPAGYELLGYTSTDGKYNNPNNTGEPTNEGIVNKDLDNQTISVHNRNGYGVTVNKTWSDAEFMQSHDDIYFAIYLRDSQGNVTLGGEKYSLLDGSVRVLKDPNTSINWFYPTLETGKTLNDYVVFEVALDEKIDPPTNNIQISETGVVTGYTTITPKDVGKTIKVGAGTPGTSGYSDSYDYTVSYERPTEDLTNERTRTDKVTNSRPGIRIIKTDMDQTPNLLNGATFKMSKILGTTKTFISGENGENGLVMVAYLDSGTSLDPTAVGAAPTYLLEEISTPNGYQALISKISIRVIRDTNGTETVYINSNPSDNYNDDPADNFSEASHTNGYYIISRGSDGYPVITIRNRKYTLQAVKYDAYSDSPMQGVKFQLFGKTVDSATGAEMPQYEPVEFEGGQTVLETDANGVIPKIVMRSDEHPDGLIPGIYYLREYETPAAYQPLGVDIRIEISENGEISLGTAKKVIDGATSWWVITQTIDPNIAKVEFNEDTQIMKISIWNIPRESIKIIKKSEGTDELMAGVHFKLYKKAQIGEDGNPIQGALPIFEGDTGDDPNKGILLLPAVEDNTTYYLFETSTLDGYNLLPGPVVITSTVQNDGSILITAKIIETYIDSNGNSQQRETVLSSVKTVENNIEVWEITIFNSLGYELPNSGGSGTLLYTLGGLALIIASALMYGFRLRRRRKEVNT